MPSANTQKPTRCCPMHYGMWMDIIERDRGIVRHRQSHRNDRCVKTDEPVYKASDMTSPTKPRLFKAS